MSSPAPSHDARWAVLFATFEFAANRFAQWGEGGEIPKDVAGPFVATLRQQLQEFRRQAEAGEAPPVYAEVIDPQAAGQETSSVRAFRYWCFIAHMLKQLKAGGRLSLAQSHALQTEVRERLAATRRRMSQEGIKLPAAMATPPDEQGEAAVVAGVQSAGGAAGSSGGDSAAREFARSADRAAAGATADDSFLESVDNPPAAARPRRNILEILLDPRSIQWLLGFGGALMVVGLVILLWLNEFFTPPVMAITLGAANVGVLLAGWSTIRYTRYQLAGRALTLLACLVMPLNLWYYQAQGLITIDRHLWVAAVIISALYAASAVLLKDEMFAYVFCAGVAMTGLLILGDWPPSPQKFWEIASPATLLVVLGLLAIHVERAFVDQEGPFSRKRFGLAFFWSGHVMLAAGLLLVLIAQIGGDWMYEIWFKPLYASMHAFPSPIVGELRWLALLLVLAGTYAYVYSDIVVRRAGVYVHIAAFTLLWAEMLIVQLLHLQLGVDALIAVLAVTSLVIHVLQATALAQNSLTRSFPVLGLLLGLLPVLLGSLVFYQNLGPRTVWADQKPEWSYVGAMLLTAIACRVGAHVHRHSVRWLSFAYFFATAAATLVGAVALLAALGFESWQEHAPILMLIPIAYLIAARLYRGHTAEEPLVAVAHAATGVMLFSSLVSAFQGFTHIVVGESLNLSLALFFSEAAAFYALATVLRKQALCVHLATVMACGAVWQVLTYFGVAAETYMLTFAVVGLLLLVGYRFAIWERSHAARLAEAAFQSANSLLSLSFISSVFLGLSRLAGRDVPWSFVGLSLTLLVLSLAAVVLVREAAWRRWYVLTSLAEGALVLLALHQLSHLTPWQKMEVFSVVAGLILLVSGHLGWYREQDREGDLVSMSLLFGSLLASVPLAIATWVARGHGQFLIVNELGFLAISVILLGSGVMLQLKSTTLVGSTMTTLYFATLLIIVRWSELNTVATAITIGGGTIFVTGLALAFFRDRLLTLPDRIKQREGLFRVFDWR